MDEEKSTRKNPTQSQPEQKQTPLEDLSMEEQINVLETERNNAKERATYMQGRIDQLKSIQKQQSSAKQQNPNE